MKRSISARMIAIFVAIAVVFLICFWVVILYMNGLLNEEYTNNVSEDTNSIIKSMEQSVNNILYSEMALANDEDVIYLANTDYDTISAIELSSLVKRLKEKMRLVTPMYLVIQDIQIHFKQSGKTLSRMEFGDTSENISDLLENTRELFNDYEGHLYGRTLEFNNFSITCELDKSSLSNLLTNETGSDYCFLSIGEIGLGRLPSDYSGLSDGVHTIRYGGERYYLSVDEWGNTRIYNAVEASRIAGVFNEGIVFSAIAIALILAATALYIFFVRRALKVPLADLCAFVGRLSSGEYGKVLEGHYPSEFGELALGMNSLLARLAYLIDVKVKNDITIRDMRLKQLQSQMNPHFLFNCFLLFRNLLNEKRYSLALELSSDLSLYFKSTMSPGETVSLIDEIMTAKIYADIQNKREDGRIQVVCEEPPFGFWQYTVPKFILQPIVENAFEYSFKDKNQGNVLRISCRDDETYLIIDVYNDGAMSEEEFCKIQKILENGFADEGMSALDNINRRLRIYNRSERGVEAKRTESGFCVSLYVRKRKTEEEGGEEE